MSDSHQRVLNILGSKTLGAGSVSSEASVPGWWHELCYLERKALSSRASEVEPLPSEDIASISRRINSTPLHMQPHRKTRRTKEELRETPVRYKTSVENHPLDCTTKRVCVERCTKPAGVSSFTESQLALTLPHFPHEHCSKKVLPRGAALRRNFLARDREIDISRIQTAISTPRTRKSVPRSRRLPSPAHKANVNESTIHWNQRQSRGIEAIVNRFRVEPYCKIGARHRRVRYNAHSLQLELVDT